MTSWSFPLAPHEVIVAQEVHNCTFSSADHLMPKFDILKTPKKFSTMKNNGESRNFDTRRDLWCGKVKNKESLYISVFDIDIAIGGFKLCWSNHCNLVSTKWEKSILAENTRSTWSRTHIQDLPVALVDLALSCSKA